MKFAFARKLLNQMVCLTKGLPIQLQKMFQIGYRKCIDPGAN